MVSSETPSVYHGAVLCHISDQREPNRRYVGVFVCKRHQGKWWMPGSLTFDLYEHSNTQAAETAVGLVYTIMGAVFEWLLTEHLFTGTHITMYMHIPHKPLKWLNTEYLPNFTFNLSLYFWSDLTVSVGKYFVSIFTLMFVSRLSHTHATANGSLSFYLSFLMEKRYLTIASFGAS